MRPDNVDSQMVTSIQERYENVLGMIKDAAEKSGRDEDSIRLMVVTKAQPIGVTRAAIEAGATLLGENYVEEAVEKIALLKGSGVEWHLIGHLQSRKAQMAALNFSMIHSLDSVKLAKKLDRFCGEANRKMPVLLEINVSGEESKYGLPAWNETLQERLIPEVEEILGMPNLDVKGLMTMPPYFSDPERTRPYFRRLRDLRDFLAKRFPSVDWRELSMGTSVDFTAAVEEGATFVRIGEAILGPRRKQG